MDTLKDIPTPRVGFTQEISHREAGSLGGKYRKKDNSFSINCQAVMMTYPYENLTKELILGRIVGRVLDLNGAVVAEEVSETGYRHFHVYADCTKKRIWTTEELDYFGGNHGHYQPVRRNLVQALAYCIKDGNFVKQGTHNFDSALKSAIPINALYRTPKQQASIVPFLKKNAAETSPSQMPDLNNMFKK